MIAKMAGGLQLRNASPQIASEQQFGVAQPP
jgi:hypothetical protein